MTFELTIGGVKLTAHDFVALDHIWDELKQVVDTYMGIYRGKKSSTCVTTINPTWTSTASTSYDTTMTTNLMVDGKLIAVKAPDPQKNELDKLIKQRDENNKSLTKAWDKGKKRRTKKK